MSAPELRLALLGVGKFGKNYARIFEQDLLVDNNILVSLEAQTSDPKEAQHLIQSDKIDGVIIATPAHTHPPLILDALSAGKHVLVEKPATLSASLMQRIQEEVLKTKCFFLESHQYRWHPAIVELSSLHLRPDELEIEYVHLFDGESSAPLQWEALTHLVSILHRVFPEVDLTEQAKVEMLKKDNQSLRCIFKMCGGSKVQFLIDSRFRHKYRGLLVSAPSRDLVFKLSGDAAWIERGNGDTTFISFDKNPLKEQVEYFCRSIKRGLRVLQGEEVKRSFKIACAIEHLV